MKITDDQKAIIIAGFGKHYTGEAIKFLTEKEIFNGNAEEFTPQSLRHIINGNTENRIVVNTLVERSLAMIAAAKQNTNQQKRKAHKLLN